MKPSAIRIFIFSYLGLLAINFFWFVSGDSPLYAEVPFRFVIGSLFIFLLPGMVWGEILGFPSQHFFETIAISFVISLAFEIVLLPIPFIFNSSIKLWLFLLFFVSFLGLLLLFLKIKKSKELQFLNPLWNFLQHSYPLNISTPLILVALAFISYGTYRWGESIMSIDGERLLHLTFIRYYYSMPMELKDFAITQGAIPQNLIHIWEYLIAGWSSLINVDPLLLFYRVRFVVPLLGFSGLYLLINNIFLDRVKSELIIWGVFIMCLGWFALLSPSGLDWVKEDQLRGLMSFMGTAHHSDSAMEILLPLGSGLALMAFRRPGYRNYFLLTSVLVAIFMWHVREFFQTAIYLGVFGITLLLAPNIVRKDMLKRWGYVVAIFLIVAICFSTAILLVVPEESRGYDELKLKEIALSYAIQNITDIRTLFNFPIDLRLTQGLDKDALVANEQLIYLLKNSWNFFLWLILSALTIPLLVLKGNKEDRHLSIFYILLWFLTLCWGFSQMLLIVLTYSEINFTTPRIMYIFSYIVIGAAFYVIFQSIIKKNLDFKYLIFCFAVFFASGFVVKLWWSSGLPFAKIISTILSILFVVLFILLLYPKMPQNHSLIRPDFFITTAAIFIFFSPILANGYASTVSKIFTQRRPPIEWFNNNNPFGFSQNLMHFIKTIPPRQTFLVNPIGNACISVYEPQYTPIPPEIMGVTLLNAREIYTETRQGKHPLFKVETPELKAEFITRPPDFMSSFKNWKGSDSIINDIANAVPPMVLHSYKGIFVFTRKPDGVGNAIRVSLSPTVKVDLPSVAFGYATNDNGFNLNPLPGQEVVFAISLRLSERTVKPVQVFLTDQVNAVPETSSITADQTSWTQYVVNKRIREGVTSVFFGILWQPETKNQWIEIKDVSIYVVDSITKYYKVPDNYMPKIIINHEAVIDMLNKYHVDYLLIQKDYYFKLLPYFQNNPKYYNIVFNYKENKELIVRYNRKSS